MKQSDTRVTQQLAIGFAFLFSSAAWAGASPMSGQAPFLLSVLVVDNSAAGPVELEVAKEKATAIFGRAGIDIEWRHFSPLTGAPSAPAWDASGRDVLPLTLILPAKKAYPTLKKLFRLPKSAMGFATTRPADKPYGDTAYIFVNRVEELIRRDAFARLGIVLGHIIAHELGHLLLGRGHTSSGLMSAQVGERTLKLARANRLHFSRPQVKKILAVVGRRTSSRRAD
jgi:hypothetical protein